MDNKQFPWTIVYTVLLTLGVAAVIAFGVAMWWVMNQAPTRMPQVNSVNSQGTNTTINSNPLPSSNINSSFTNSTPLNSSNSTQTATDSPCPDAGACNADAQTYCPDEWKGTSIQASWKLDLVNCLYDDHKNDISDACLESLECRQTLNDNLVSACQADQRQFCSGVRPSPGSEPLVDCLEEHFDQLSAECADAWTQHDAAKPN